MPSRIATTRSERVYEEVRKEILHGTFPPGSRLRFVDLAARFTVSQSVVREALMRLAEQGLAVALPQQGFRVRPLDLADLNEITEARVEIESLVVRSAIARGDLQWESSVIAAHHTLARTPTMTKAGKTSEEWADAHEVFHHTTLQGCGNGRLLSIATSLREAASLYRWWSGSMAPDADRDVALEHRQILDAVVARDEINAACLIAQHIQRTTDALTNAVTRLKVPN
ncbi:DNA-binding GntR family transcriptional regulator [Streptomyces aurantiacus]|uniref:GntR family transcriptional regulator n=1 Tax=Streptomyces aurantiacus TaxID=47760 RepID=UPI002790AB41|nr:GntR family transcriptional regulator [Streptomyces aurantiacus]MDQ0775802.1 DNA-binding GntR family transcriptional regulator [Streptomyces aurantiacus]